MDMEAFPAPTLEERMDRLPPTRAHVIWIAVIGIALLLENFDNSVFAYMAPAVGVYWKLSLKEIGLVNAAVFMGMFVGALGGGRLSDYLGRKPMMVWGSVIYALASLYSALAPNLINLFISRIVAGIGVEMAVGVMLIYIAETFPRSTRGRFMAAVILVASAAGPITSNVVQAIVPTAPTAWRWVFVLGLAGIPMAIIAAVVLPESVRWMNTHGQEDRAERIVTRLEASVLQNGRALPPIHRLDISPIGGSIKELLRPQYIYRFLSTSIIFGTFVYCIYGFASWVPTVLVHNGVPLNTALDINTNISYFVFAAPVALFLIGDRIHRKTALMLECLLVGSVIILFGYAHSQGAIIALGGVIFFGLQASTGSFYSYIPEIFPTNVRGIGTGSVNSVARIAGMLQGLTIGSFVGWVGSIHLYMIIGIAMIAVALAIQILGRKTSRMSVDEAGDPDDAEGFVRPNLPRALHPRGQRSASGFAWLGTPYGDAADGR